MSIADKIKYRKNVINICVDDVENNEICGRLFHCYQKEATKYAGVVDLVGKMDALFESIQYPQATVRIRNFLEEKEPIRIDKDNTAVSAEYLLEQSGEKGTFIVTVESRVNATWQGTVYHVESETEETFSSDMALLDLANKMLKL